MFGFGKKKENADDKVPSGMQEVADRMMSGNFTMDDMLAQMKQIKKMSNFSGLLKLVPGAKEAVGAMKEKIQSGEVDKQIKILEAMTAEERSDPDKIFAHAKQRIADESGASVRDVEQLIKRYNEMQRQMKMIQKHGGMEAIMQKMQNMPGPK